MAGKPITTKEFVARAMSVHGSIYDYSKTEYVGSTKKVAIRCKSCGHVFQQTAHNHLQGSGCSCQTAYAPNKSNANRLATFLHKLEARHPDKFELLSTQYLNQRTQLLLRCKSCGSQFKSTGGDLLSGRGCPSYVCRYGRLTKPKKTFVQEATAIHGDRYVYGKYRGTQTNMKMKCTSCGRVFYQWPRNHLSYASGCPYCHASTSSGENSLAVWLRSLHVRVITTNRKILNGKEIDIFLPDHGLGIEFNGLYWHDAAHKGRLYHQQKSRDAAAAGIALFHVWEHQWRTQQAIVKSMLLVRLGLANRIAARATEVRRLENSDTAEFLRASHLQGFVSASISYGLFHDGALVEVMSFGRSRFADGFDFELLRLGSALNTVVVGGASRLFNAFKRDHPKSSVVSYADLDHGTGHVYTQLGFKWVGVTDPAYFWVKGTEVISRYKAQKRRLSRWLPTWDPNKTERANLESAGYRRVFTSGNAIYQYMGSK